MASNKDKIIRIADKVSLRLKELRDNGGKPSANRIIRMFTKNDEDHAAVRKVLSTRRSDMAALRRKASFKKKESKPDPKPESKPMQDFMFDIEPEEVIDPDFPW